MLKNLVVLGVLSSIFTGCIEQLEESSQGQTNATLSHYGHLTSVDDYNASPLFLSTLKKDQDYKICLSEKLTKKYPGIKEEIEASVNVWAHYIDRKIPVNIVVKNLPFPSHGWDVKDFSNAYKQICGKSDLYISEDYPSGNKLAYTQRTLRYYPQADGRKEISEFDRVLNLVAWPTASGKKFVSLEQVTNKKRTADEIFKMLISRDQTIYLTEENTFLTTTTLVHEFGHIWGLCDQYPLDGGQTNCDPNHSTLSPQGHIILEEDAVMSSAGWKNQLGLHDDDIEGIQDLAQRGDLAKTGWGKPTKALHDYPARTKQPGPVRLLKVRSAEFDNDGVLEVLTAMDVDGPYKLILHMKYNDRENWRTSGPTFRFSAGTSTRNMRLQIRGINKERVEKIRLIYVDSNHSGNIDDELLDGKSISNTIEL